MDADYPATGSILHACSQERLERAAAGRNVTFKWVRSHDGNKFNERADRLAYAGSRKAEKIINSY